ncbi:beta-ketoacyl synthase N-terminal-like domain-containing protein, partial [Streptomyces sp. NPDC020141]|uniref:beta-ketoacyl synthase N-terminal-like domain-containing protein n=1 Tax=Streptomyces sp. NPDC020141 TaxID=3365065 RepID=UPI0037A99E31
MACRLPGAPDPESFWRLLREGRDAVTEAPKGRWALPEEPDGTGPRPAAPGTRRGGFLDRVDLFDADFFGVSPREAAAMDPQQRLMLELSWEALEDAGLIPGRLRGSDTGVFTGVMADDYATLTRRQGVGSLTRHSLTGLHRGVIANRVSYTLDLRGPSMAVDTGQSSSLVAVHAACESLRGGTSTLALAGGVQLNLAGESAVGVSEFGALSPDGRCYTFDARANGFVRGEGGGVVVLKPLDRALADGDPVYCVLLGSAVNNDGATDGLTRPSPDRQSDVVRAAQRMAGVKPSEVAYVELHGTATRVGDPVEAAALGAVFAGEGPRDEPLRVGSAKTNIGHLEAAAGIVGLLKAALSVSRAELAPSINYERPHPDIPLDEWGLRVQRELSGWPGSGRRVAGVSSFGMGGTNCHVVLAEPPAAEAVPSPAVAATGPGTAWTTEPGAGTAWTTTSGPVPVDDGFVSLPLSGKSASALAAQAGRLRDHLTRNPHIPLPDIAHALTVTRPV